MWLVTREPTLTSISTRQKDFQNSNPHLHSQAAHSQEDSLTLLNIKGSSLWLKSKLNATKKQNGGNTSKQQKQQARQLSKLMKMKALKKETKSMFKKMTAMTLQRRVRLNGSRH
jgi:hypothetical protein